MQSWGTSSRFQRRMTGAHPSKSAIVGIIAAAMGIDREDSARLSELSSLRMTTFLLPRSNQTLRLLDYHTVGGGFDKKTHPLNIPRKASGSASDNAVVTTREYLTESRFGVLLEGGGVLIAEVETALKDPCRGIWLGRKCCIPATPVCAGVFDSRTTAFESLLERASIDPSNSEKAFGRTEESEPTDPQAESQHDIPLDFDPNAREFGVRFVRRSRPISLKSD
jgi:CRISPR system Cascade subunit CasD